MSFDTSGLFITTLDCDHVYTTTYYPPGAEYYCRRCEKMRTTLSSFKKYQWVCYTCRQSRSYIATRLRGENVAMKHFREAVPDHTHHVVYRTIDGKVLWDSRPVKQVQEELW